MKLVLEELFYGNRGRLMCCLCYEQDTYDYEIKHTPPIDTLVKTVDGVGTVCEISPLAGTVKVKLSAQPEISPKTYKREELKILKKSNNKKPLANTLTALSLIV